MTRFPPADLWLTDHAILAVRGPDARAFLQGQLSQDVLTLAPGEVRRAALNNPQGRCLVLLELLAETAQDVLCITPSAQAETLQQTLRRYLLRSKVRLENETEHYRLCGRWSAPPGTTSASGTPGATATAIHWPRGTDGRHLQLSRAAAGADPGHPDEYAAASSLADLRAWHRADLAAGLPRLGPQTEGEFVAQMLNLDVLGAISFKKGCYTGQEVIARAHFRGRVKRRLQRFRIDPAAGDPPLPGESITLSDGRSATVVDLLEPCEGQAPPSELLAVTTFGGAALPEALPLPYALPD